MPDYLDTARKAIEDQISSLRNEITKLEKAAQSLAPDGRGRGRRRATATRRGGARKAANGRRKTGRRGRPRGSGTRANQALAIVKRRPGATIPEIAKEMNIKQNYLYRVMPTLQKERKVSKRGKGWHPA